MITPVPTTVHHVHAPLHLAPAHAGRALSPRARAALAAATLALVVPACSSESTGSGTTTKRVALDAQAFCDRYIGECGATEVTMDECVQTSTVLRVAPACRDAMNTTTCDELLADDSSAEKLCFPSCSAEGSQKCNGDGTITTCVASASSGALRTYVLDCAAVCTTSGFESWSGVCGTAYQGQAADEDKCWCK